MSFWTVLNFRLKHIYIFMGKTPIMYYGRNNLYNLVKQGGCQNNENLYKKSTQIIVCTKQLKQILMKAVRC